MCDLSFKVGRMLSFYREIDSPIVCLHVMVLCIALKIQYVLGPGFHVFRIFQKLFIDAWVDYFLVVDVWKVQLILDV